MARRRIAADKGLLDLPKPPKAKRMRRGLRWLFTGMRPEPQPSYIGPIEPPDDAAVGICCSGGGIRSAAFNLGALQALRAAGDPPARKISGSGVGWLVHRGCLLHGRQAQSEGRRRRLGPEGVRFHEHRPSIPARRRIQYLRNRSSYLAPDGLSKLFLAYRVLLGLVFNLFFLGLALVAIGIALGWAVYRPLYGSLADPIKTCPDGIGNVCGFAADVPDLFWWVLGVFGLAILINGLLLLLLRPPTDFWRRGLETWAVRLMLATAAIAVVFVAIPVLAQVLLNYGEENREPGRRDSVGAKPPGGRRRQLRDRPPCDPAPVAGTSLRAGDRATGRQGIPRLLHAPRFPLAARPRVPRRRGDRAAAAADDRPRGSVADARALVALGDRRATVLLIGVVCAAGFGVLYYIADLNTWSLHPFYRRRLCTAFALKRVLEARPPDGQGAKYEKLVPLSESGVDGTGLADARRVRRRQRLRSRSDAARPRRDELHLQRDGDRRAARRRRADRAVYESAIGKNRKRDITLPAAVAMSGAALSPSMGKQTRRPLTFLMALANVRLGVWIPNPRFVADWEQRGFGDPQDRRDFFKRPRPKYLFRELLGRNRA